MPNIRVKYTDIHGVPNGEADDVYEIPTRESARDFIEIECRATSCDEYTNEVLRQWDLKGSATVPNGSDELDHWTYED